MPMRPLTYALGAVLLLLTFPAQAAAENFRCGSFPLLDDTISKEERADRLLRRAIACVQEGKPMESIAVFSELIGLDPDNETAYLNRGNAYIQTGQFELGIADYSHVIAKNPSLAQGWYNRGTAFVAARQYERAIADLTEAIRLKPDEARAYCNRGMSYLRKSHYERALADLNAGIEKDGTIALCYYARGDLSLHTEKYQDAVGDLTRGLRLKPTVEGYIQRAAAHERLCETDNALADYKEALRLDPRSNAARAGAQRLSAQDIP